MLRCSGRLVPDTRKFNCRCLSGCLKLLQQSQPDDYVIATGASHSIRDLLQAAFHHVGIDDWTPFVVQDERFFRPADVAVLVGDSSKAQAKLGWHPTVGFQQLIEMMVDADLENEKRNPGPAEYTGVPHQPGETFVPVR